MRILHINKFGWPKGGSDVYMLRTCERLAALPGTTVGLWAENPKVAAPVVVYEAEIPDFRSTPASISHGGQGRCILTAHLGPRPASPDFLGSN